VSARIPLDRLTTPTRVYEELKALGGGPIHSLGQNFLLDRPLLEALVRDLEVGGSDCVVEIGPGLGHLTRALLETGCRVFAVEKDRRLASSLETRLAHPPRLKVVHEDILELDWSEVASWADGPRPILAGALPYYCSSPILAGAFEEWYPDWSRAGFLLQEEVVDRLVSPPGGKTFGRLSVLCQAFSTPRKLRRVPAHLFVPKPEVSSAWCVLTPNEAPPSVTAKELSQATTVCFAERRKTLLNNLGRKLGRPEAQACLDRACIDGGQRAEELSVGEFVRLTEVLSGEEARGLR